MIATFNVDKYLSGHVWGALFIFARVGCFMMLFPGLSEAFVNARTRFFIAAGISLLLMGPLLPHLPAAPVAIPDMFKLLCYEIIIGLFLGTLMRVLLSTLEATGMVIALQAGLSNAQILNPALAAQSTLPSALLSVVGVTIIFVSGFDHVLLRSLVHTYDVFPPGSALMPGDMAESLMQFVNKSFVTGIELAMPFFVIGLLFYVVLGIMQKLMPQIQIFMAAMPVQIWMGLFLIALTVTGILTIWMRYVDSTWASMLGG